MPKTQPQIILGFDFGMSKIGVAIGQAITKSANPLAILPADDGVPNWQAIQEIIDTWKVDAIVVGIPYSMDGSEQTISLAARKFARKLEGRFHLPVFLSDERLTTIEARQQLFDTGTPSSKLSKVDSYAAKLILESWLQQKPGA